jgi:hypothetical protein
MLLFQFGYEQQRNKENILRLWYYQVTKHEKIHEFLVKMW